MDSEIILALVTLFGNIVTLICGLQVIKYRIAQLEKKVEKHNQFYDKVNELEKEEEINKVEHLSFDKRITILERGVSND
jgi:transcription elongation factor Elf1